MRFSARTAIVLVLVALVFPMGATLAHATYTCCQFGYNHDFGIGNIHRRFRCYQELRVENGYSQLFASQKSTYGHDGELITTHPGNCDTLTLQVWMHDNEGNHGYSSGTEYNDEFTQKLSGPVEGYGGFTLYSYHHFIVGAVDRSVCLVTTNTNIWTGTHSGHDATVHVN